MLYTNSLQAQNMNCKTRASHNQQHNINDCRFSLLKHTKYDTLFAKVWGKTAVEEYCSTEVQDPKLNKLNTHLNPVGHQSTNWIVRLVLMVATAALTSLGTTSPRYIRQQAMYLP